MECMCVYLCVCVVFCVTVHWVDVVITILSNLGARGPGFESCWIPRCAYCDIYPGACCAAYRNVCSATYLGTYCGTRLDCIGTSLWYMLSRLPQRYCGTPVTAAMTAY